jgi:hypothetical protein
MEHNWLASINRRRLEIRLQFRILVAIAILDETVGYHPIEQEIIPFNLTLTISLTF